MIKPTTTKKHEQICINLPTLHSNQCEFESEF